MAPTAISSLRATNAVGRRSTARKLLARERPNSKSLPRGWRWSSESVLRSMASPAETSADDIPLKRSWTERCAPETPKRPKVEWPSPIRCRVRESMAFLRSKATVLALGIPAWSTTKWGIPCWESSSMRWERSVSLKCPMKTTALTRMERKWRMTTLVLSCSTTSIIEAMLRSRIFLWRIASFATAGGVKRLSMQIPIDAVRFPFKWSA